MNTHTKEYISNFNIEKNIMPYFRTVTSMRDERKVCAKTGMQHVASKRQVS